MKNVFNSLDWDKKINKKLKSNPDMVATMMMRTRNLMIMTSCTARTKIDRRKAATKTPKSQAGSSLKILRNSQSILDRFFYPDNNSGT